MGNVNASVLFVLTNPFTNALLPDFHCAVPANDSIPRCATLVLRTVTIAPSRFSISPVLIYIKPDVLIYTSPVA